MPLGKKRGTAPAITTDTAPVPAKRAPVRSSGTLPTYAQIEAIRAANPMYGLTEQLAQIANLSADDTLAKWEGAPVAGWKMDKPLTTTARVRGTHTGVSTDLDKAVTVRIPTGMKRVRVETAHGAHTELAPATDTPANGAPFTLALPNITRTTTARVMERAAIASGTVHVWHHYGATPDYIATGEPTHVVPIGPALPAPLATVPRATHGTYRTRNSHKRADKGHISVYGIAPAPARTVPTLTPYPSVVITRADGTVHTYDTATHTAHELLTLVRDARAAIRRAGVTAHPNGPLLAPVPASTRVHNGPLGTVGGYKRVTVKGVPHMRPVRLFAPCVYETAPATGARVAPYGKQLDPFTPYTVHGGFCAVPNVVLRFAYGSPVRPVKVEYVRVYVRSDSERARIARSSADTQSVRAIATDYETTHTVRTPATDTAPASTVRTVHIVHGERVHPLRGASVLSQRGNLLRVLTSEGAPFAPVGRPKGETPAKTPTERKRAERARKRAASEQTFTPIDAGDAMSSVSAETSRIRAGEDMYGVKV